MDWLYSVQLSATITTLKSRQPWSSYIWESKPDLVLSGSCDLFEWGIHSNDRTGLPFTAIKIKDTSQLY
jgi:hypothetical protein